MADVPDTDAVLRAVNDSAHTRTRIIGALVGVIIIVLVSYVVVTAVQTKQRDDAITRIELLARQNACRDRVQDATLSAALAAVGRAIVVENPGTDPEVLDSVRTLNRVRGVADSGVCDSDDPPDQPV